MAQLQAPYNVVRYEIVPNEAAETCFSINEETGDIILKRSLLLEPCTAGSYNVSYYFI